MGHQSLKSKGAVLSLDGSKTVQLTSAIWENKGVIQCVYKIYFDEYFYIGSTNNFKERIFRHFFNFRTNEVYRKASKMVMAAYENCSIVKFEVLELVSDLTKLRDIERTHICNNLNNPLLLNKNTETKMIVGFNSQKRMVVKYNNDGTAEYYQSIMEAAESVGTSYGKFRRNLKRGWKSNGLLFRIIDLDGNVLIPLKSNKKKGRKKGSVGTPSKFGKEVTKCTTDGAAVEVFSSIASAAKHMGADVEYFRKTIKRSPRNYYKGYIFKYA